MARLIKGQSIIEYMIIFTVLVVGLILVSSKGFINKSLMAFNKHFQECKKQL